MKLRKKLIIDSLKNHAAFTVINKYGKKLVSKSLILISHSLQDNLKALETYEKAKITQEMSHIFARKIYLGLKVSKKCGRTAVIRNTIKRRIKACMRQIISQYLSVEDNANTVLCSLSTNHNNNNYIESTNNRDFNKQSNIIKKNSLLSRAYLIIPHKHLINVSYLELSNELQKLLRYLI
ncbi:ribonuclease P [Orientia tsutsugamushi]|uniref:Ribonuclease P n=1 Tax=Orientia tsutsugamushi TaxID=784 RepID=A0A2U3QRA5_ORITS|nr:ribonuclease P protein component [Orientia tsutsugamushi]KJV72409.1 ribonuclease P family protein [Orientia tsutsugamushi str. UT76]SPR03482.1 ribonuclease P [Orientia tsutsugamushi]